MIADATTGGLSIASTGVIATYQAIPDALQLQPRPIAVGGFSQMALTVALLGGAHLWIEAAELPDITPEQPSGVADVKISALPAGSVTGVTDVLPMVQGGVTNKITVAQLFTNPVQQTYEDFTGIVTAATDAKTWSIRLTAPATVNAHACIEFEE